MAYAQSQSKRSRICQDAYFEHEKNHPPISINASFQSDYINAISTSSDSTPKNKSIKDIFQVFSQGLPTIQIQDNPFIYTNLLYNLEILDPIQTYAPLSIKPTPKSPIQNPFLSCQNDDSLQESPVHIQTHTPF